MLFRSDTRINIDEASDIFKLICDFLQVPSDLDAEHKPATNPLLEREISQTWPIPNARLEKISTAAAIYESAPEEISDGDVALLIKQIQDRRSVSDVYLPPRLSVSTLIALKEDPDALAQSIRRPMPFLQDQFARRGTEFHNWIESYLKAETLFDDEDLDYFDPLEEDGKLEELKKKWLESD